MFKILKTFIILLIFFFTRCPGGSGEELPQFPWPPPKASAFDKIPTKLLNKEHGRTYLKDVAQRIETALNKLGYHELKWFAVKDGFVIMTRLEQFHFNGASLSGQSRWSTEISGGFWDFLLKPKKGHFRQFIFVVTTHIINEIPKNIDYSELKTWFGEGIQSGIPSIIGDIPFAKTHKCIVFIYEFEKYPEDSRMFFKSTSNLQGRTHLKKSKLWELLNIYEKRKK